MTSKFSEHTNANYFLHTGSGLQGRPSMGAWTTYGLGSECQELPGFVVLNGGLIPPGGLDNFASGFLPATYQGSIFKPVGVPVANIERTERQRPLAAAEAGPDGPARPRVCRSARARRRRRNGHRQLRTGLPHAVGRARARWTWPASRRPRRSCTASTPGSSRRASSRPNACSRGGWSSAACGSSS